jgi:hypothetical protein
VKNPFSLFIPSFLQGQKLLGMILIRRSGGSGRERRALKVPALY